MVVVGHRGKGMNALASPDARLRGDVRENTLRSFNDAARCPGVDYVEFDVQVRACVAILLPPPPPPPRCAQVGRLIVVRAVGGPGVGTVDTWSGPLRLAAATDPEGTRRHGQLGMGRTARVDVPSPVRSSSRVL